MNTQQIIEQAELRCKKQGARLTSKRKQVLAGLLQSDKALSAYELVDYCKNEFDTTIPAMSVYRILTFLENEQLVHRLKLANKYIACAHIACDHDHVVPQFLICGQCQRVKEISIDKSIIQQLVESVKEAGFQLRSTQLEMDSLCQNCMSSTA